MSINAKDEDGRTELHRAKGDVQHLLARGADPNIQDDGGWTPLISAASSGDFEKFRCLISHPSIDVNMLTESGTSALHYAASKGHNEILTLLLQRDDIKMDVQDTNSRFTPLMRAIISKKNLCAQKLIQAGAKLNLRDVEGDTALHHAAMTDNIPIALMLIENGAKTDIENKQHQTALQVASPMMAQRIEEEA
ncbi:unnamed protein product [Blepharisma stoltei]|uniref:26S proteasome non-ATPase regulatory subunit 10 n=1 Tax=Blepharisma stoltei TaxID=1481888 RepID=A0AAU9JRQ3_9CILI|nr:unnamed protein product [Blepharisma stoltei]